MLLQLVMMMTLAVLLAGKLMPVRLEDVDGHSLLVCFYEIYVPKINKHHNI